MAMNHIGKYWLTAEDDLVEAVARELAARHGSEIFGYAAVTEKFLDQRWRMFENDARSAIALVRSYDRDGKATLGHVEDVLARI